MRHYFITKFGIDSPKIDDDQMPLHKNGSSGQATLSLKSNEEFFEENHHLRELITIFTQIASNENIQLVQEFVFKGTGKRLPKLTPPNNYHWADKGSLKTIKHLTKSIQQI